MADLATLPGVSTGGNPLSLRNRLNRRWGTLKTERSSWDQHVRDVFDLTRPRRTRFSQSQINKGDRRNNSIIDNTGVIAARVLTSGLVNGMSSPAQPWFRYEPDDLDLLEYGPVKEWLGDLERLVRRIFNASNVYEALPVLYEELILATTAAGVVEDDFNDVIRLSTFTWGEYALGVNGRRQVDTLYREMKMSVLNCVQKFGLKNCSQTVRGCYDRASYDDWVDVMHAIEPNMERDADKADAKNMAFRSIYWEPASTGPDQSEKFLRQSGYRDNPIIAPRWDVIGYDVYGSTCPGMEALGDMRQLQIQQKRKGTAIDKQVNPATQGPPSLHDRFVQNLPGQHNVVANAGAGSGISKLYEVSVNLNDMVADIQDTRSRVQEAFFQPYILSISTMEGVQPRNSTEIAERKGEGLLVLGPVVQRLQNELHNPLHNRTLNRIYDICEPLWKAGEAAMIRPPPPELQGRPVQIAYISSLAQVQKAQAITGMERLLGTVSNLMAVFPDMGDKIDAQQFVDEMADHLGTPAKIVRSDEKVEALAQQRQQQEQMQQTAAMAGPIKDATVAAKNLSETNIGNGKGALQAMLETAKANAEAQQGEAPDA